MIERYTRPEMGAVWDLEMRFQKMMEVEIAVAQVQSKEKIIPSKAASAIKRKAKFNVERIHEIEKTTRHDVIAFVSNMAENVGPEGRYIHFGMTSSDVLDTALSLQVVQAYEVLKKSLHRFEKVLRRKASEHAGTLCAGRTHGMHAEPTSFGLKLSGLLVEFLRNQKRVERAIESMKIVKLSGAVGTYSAMSAKVEKGVGKLLGLKPETVATQVIPRDRHAELLQSLALLGCGLERLAVELRHLQRTEVGEAIEGFSKGQKGSSAMPHKKNPISSENITGVARLLRSYAQSALENVALWHERDISHSSVERVVFPDAFILVDYAVDRMATVVENLYVDEERMLKNIQLSQGQLFSSHVLLVLVEAGYSREEAYAKVQSLSHGLKAGESLEEALMQDPELQEKVDFRKIRKIFSGEIHRKSVQKLVKKVLK